MKLTVGDLVKVNGEVMFVIRVNADWNMAMCLTVDTKTKYVYQADFDTIEPLDLDPAVMDILRRSFE